MNAKSLTSVAALLLSGLALTACQSGTSGTTTGAAPGTATAQAGSGSGSGSGSGAAVAATHSPAASSKSNGGSTGGSTAGAAKSGGTQTGGTTGGSTKGSSDSYAYTHPCAPEQLAVTATRRSGSATQWVIAVRNNGTKSCGLSYYPLVSLDNAKAADGSKAVRPLVPGGLGGAPAYPVYAGRTAYAVVDLDPSGATTGTVAGIDELNVLADGDHMPNAATLNFPLGSGARVLKPKLGLYRDNVADAVSSMKQADTQS